MPPSHILKADNKPQLFSFDLKTELENIDRWVFDNKRYSKRDLEAEADILKKIAYDFIVIIESNTVTVEQLDHLFHAVKNGASGVWEPATTKLMLLAYHFDNAKQRLIREIKSSDSKNVERLLNCVSGCFSQEELLEIFTVTFGSKSKKVRMKTAETILELRNQYLIPFLQNMHKIEKDKQVADSILFAIENFKQPEGRISL